MSARSANSSTRRWRTLRAAKLERDPICQLCRRAPATEVDHVQQLKDGGARYAWRNLRSTCDNCHKIRHGKRPRPDIDPGTGLPTSHHWWAE